MPPAKVPTLPIIRVTPLTSDIMKVDFVPGREEPEPLRPDVAACRTRLIAGVAALSTQVAAQQKAYPDVPVVARARLTKMVKSSRPVPPNRSALFSARSCPMIGVEPGRHLLVRATAEGVDELARKVRENAGPWADFHVTNVEELRAVTADDALNGWELSELASIWAGGVPLNIRLFDHDITTVNWDILQAFTKRAQKLGVTAYKLLDAGEHLTVLSLMTPASGNREEVIREIAAFPGTQRVTPPPEISVVRTQAGVVSPMDPAAFSAPADSAVYPVVGLVDTGIDPANDFFKRGWLVAQYNHVPSTDYDHGTRVGSLMVHPRVMNQNDPWFPNCSSKIVDLAAIQDGYLDHNLLVMQIEEAVKAHPEVRVWNFSFCMKSRRVVDDVIHEFTNKLDQLQRVHDVLFVFAGGNIEDANELISWPPPKQPVDERRRILVPADSVLGVTVGALAHVSRPGFTMNERGDLSPFSRHGPGIGGMPKPDLIHCGGNCDSTGNSFQCGVRSMNKEWKLAELHGSSFAAPLVSTTAAQLNLRLTEAIGQRPHRALLKGLLIHSAAANNEDRLLKHDKEYVTYRGRGTPPSPERALLCTENEMTVIFEGELQPGHSQRFFKSDFPLPPCLRQKNDDDTNTFRGDVILTVCCDPPLNANYGGEYCSLDLKSKFGTVDSEYAFEGKMPEDKAKIEARHIAEDQKWSPVKVHTHRFRGMEGDTWELRVEVQARDYYHEQLPQKFFVIMTIRDPKGEAPVYNEMFARMQAMGWPIVAVKQQQRLRPR